MATHGKARFLPGHYRPSLSCFTGRFWGATGGVFTASRFSEGRGDGVGSAGPPSRKSFSSMTSESPGAEVFETGPELRTACFRGSTVPAAGGWEPAGEAGFAVVAGPGEVGCFGGVGDNCGTGGTSGIFGNGEALGAGGVFGAGCTCGTAGTCGGVAGVFSFSAAAAGSCGCSMGRDFDVETDFTGTPRGLVIGAGGVVVGGVGRPGPPGVTDPGLVAGVEGRWGFPGGTGYLAEPLGAGAGWLSPSPANFGEMAGGGICRLPAAGGAGGAIPLAPSAFGGRGRDV